MKTYKSAIVASVVGHYVSYWVHRVMLVRPKLIVRRALRGILMRMSRIFSTTSFETITVLLGITPLDLGVRRHTWAYWLRRDRPESIQKVLRVRAEMKRGGGSSVADGMEPNHWEKTWDGIFSTRYTCILRGCKVKSIKEILYGDCHCQKFGYLLQDQSLPFKMAET